VAAVPVELEGDRNDKRSLFIIYRDTLEDDRRTKNDWVTFISCLGAKQNKIVTE
jgi:hypothetical protein